MSQSPRTHRRALLATAALAAATSFLPTVATAQAGWPNRPIKLIVPFPPGGGSDVIARTISTRLSARLGQPIVIENRGGAGGALATDLVAKAPADGYTLLFVTTAMATNTASGKKLPFDLMKDLTPIGQIGATPLLIVTGANAPIKSMRELLDQARAKPDGLTYGSSGVGSMSHIGMALVASEAKVKMLHVPYKGTSLAVTDLAAGQLQAILGTFATSWQLVEGGKLRALAVTGTQRVPLAPNVPTMTELGVPGAQIDFWWGMMAPSKVPADIIKRVNEDLNAVLVQPEMRELLAREVAVPKPGSPEDFGKLISFEINRWGKLIKDAAIKME